MTETQPDPQVVAWHLITGWSTLCGKPSGEFAGAVTLRVDQVTCPDCRARLPKPLAVADIPAGQGPASLYVDEYGVVRYRAASGRSAVIPAGWIARDIDERDALNAALDHLAATLPTITTEETL